MTETNYNKSFYILGTSLGGPVNTPILIETVTEGMSIFGDSPLMDAWNEAKQTQGDNVNVYLVRINGSESFTQIQGINIDESKLYNPISISSYSAGDLWNNCSVVVTPEYIKLSNPKDIGGAVTIHFESHVTIGQVVSAINFAFERGAVSMIASTVTPHRPSTDIVRAYVGVYGEPVYFSGGSDEAFFTKNELHRKLDMTYNILEGQAIDVIAVIDAYFDDIPPTAYDESGLGELFYSANRDYLELPKEDSPSELATFHGQMIDFCKKQMSFSIMTHGVMAFNPIENVEDILASQAYLTKVASTTCLSDRYDIIRRTGETKVDDDGKFLSITLGELEYLGLNNSLYYNNAYVAYGAMLASTLTSQSFTNMVVPNINNMRYYLEDDESYALSKLGITTFRKSILKGGIVVTNGVTASLSTSPYHTVSNVRMVQMILNTFTLNLDEFKGENVDMLIKNQSIEKRVDELTKALVSANVAKDIQSRCYVSPVGVALIELDVMPIYSMEYVKVTSSIKL